MTGSERLNENLSFAKNAVDYAAGHIKYSDTYACFFGNVSKYPLNQHTIKKLRNTSLDLAYSLYHLYKLPVFLKEEIINSAKEIRKQVKQSGNKAGNCGENSKFSLAYLRKTGYPRLVELFHAQKNDDHAFVVIDRDPASPINQPAKWGPYAVIVDAWTHNYFAVSRGKIQNDFFKCLPNFITDFDSHNIHVMDRFNDEESKKTDSTIADATKIVHILQIVVKIMLAKAPSEQTAAILVSIEEGRSYLNTLQQDVLPLEVEKKINKLIKGSIINIASIYHSKNDIQGLVELLVNPVMHAFMPGVKADELYRRIERLFFVLHPEVVIQMIQCLKKENPALVKAILCKQNFESYYREWRDKAYYIKLGCAIPDEVFKHFSSTPLICSKIQNGDTAYLSRYLQLGLPTWIKLSSTGDIYQGSLLHYTVLSEQPECLKLVLSKNEFDLNKADSRHCTPLMWAVLKNQVDCAALLLEKKADPHLHINGITALSLAKQQGNQMIIKLINNAGKKIESASAENLDYAAASRLLHTPDVALMQQRN